MMRSNYAPTARTIIVALVLIVIGLLGTYGTMVPNIAGILAFVVAIGLLLLGMAVRRI